MKKEQKKKTIWRIILYCLVFLGAFSFLIARMCPEPYWGEGPLLCLMGGKLSISHPPGYPLFCLLSFIVNKLPMGSAIYRVNLLSVILGALTIAFLARFLSEYCFIESAGLVAFAFILNPVFTMSAVRAEIYSLNLFFIISIFVLLGTNFTLKNHTPVSYVHSANPGKNPAKKMFLAAFIAGFGLSNHMTFVLITPLLVYKFSGALRYSKRRKSAAAICFFLLIFSSSLLIYDPIRAFHGSFWSWGESATFDGFFTLTSAAEEAVPSLESGPTGGEFIHSLLHNTFPIVLEQLPVPLWALVFLGLIFFLIRQPSKALMFVVTELLFLSAVTFYNTNEPGYFLLPAVFLFMEPAAAGAGKIAAWLSRLKLRTSTLRILFFVLLGVAAGLSAASRELPDLSRNYVAMDYGKQVWNEVREKSLFITRRSDLSFLLWYQQFMEYRGQGQLIIFKHLLCFEWFFAEMRDRYPRISFPAVQANQFEDAPGWSNAVTEAMIRLNLLNPSVYCGEPRIIPDYKRYEPALQAVPAGLTYRLAPQQESRESAFPVNIARGTDHSQIDPWSADVLSKVYFDMAEVYRNRDETEKFSSAFKLSLIYKKLGTGLHESHHKRR